MKNIIVIFLIINLYACAQWKSHYSNDVLGFMNIVESKHQKQTSMDQKIDLTANEIDDLVKKMYKAIANDQIGFKRYIEKRNDDTKINNTSSINEIKPTFGMTLNEIQQKIIDYYSKEYLELIKIPYYIRIKVIKRSKTYFQDVVPIEKIILNGRIEDVIKGEDKFNDGDQIQFSYLQTWRTGENCMNDFEEGKSYFVPIFYFTLNGSDYEYGAKCFDDDNCGIYLIKDNFIKTPGNFFKISEYTDWKNFKSQFISNYIIKE